MCVDFQQVKEGTKVYDTCNEKALGPKLNLQVNINLFILATDI